MKLTKYYSLVLSVFSDQLTFNRQLNANQLHVLLRNRERPNNLFASVRCIGEDCNSKEWLPLRRNKSRMRASLYKRKMRSRP